MAHFLFFLKKNSLNFVRPVYVWPSREASCCATTNLTCRFCLLAHYRLVLQVGYFVICLFGWLAARIFSKGFATILNEPNRYLFGFFLLVSLVSFSPIFEDNKIPKTDWRCCSSLLGFKLIAARWRAQTYPLCKGRPPNCPNTFASMETIAYIFRCKIKNCKCEILGKKKYFYC